MSQAIICDKAESIFDELNEKEGGDETFGGSRAWFAGYKRRTECRSVKITDEAAGVEAFLLEFQAIVQSYEYPEDLTFSADKTGLYWKRIPSRIFLALKKIVH